MPARVLIVDDCTDTVASLVTLLTFCGFEARGAADAPAALRAVSEFTPCVVITDIRLPGDSGESLARRLLGLPGPRPKVVVLSGLMDHKDNRGRLTALGVDGCLTKPADPTELVKRVRELCGG